MARASSFVPKGVHRVRKRLANGSVREYHYAYRGGPRFWASTQSEKPGDPAYALAFSDALRGARVIQVVEENRTTLVIEKYTKSAHFQNLKARTQGDYSEFLRSFEMEFGEDPIGLFEERESLVEIEKWKEQWKHSPRRYDYAGTVVTRLLNWARNAALIEVHHHTNVERLYKANRADIVWLPEEVERLLSVASERERRVVIAASEGGLTPQDIGILTREHVQRTPGGRRLFFRRTKTSNPVSIPVTPALAELIDTTPEDQTHLIVSLEGRHLTSLRASQIVRTLKERANEEARHDRSKVHVRDELRLNDLRGTAATALLRAGCSLNQIAVTMGWGIRHAANIIERYAVLVPEVSDEVLAKLTAAQRE